MKACTIPLLLALALILSSAACGGGAANGGNGGTAPPAGTAPAPDASAAQGESAAAYPLTFDNYGRTVTVGAKPRKVLTLGPNCTEVFAALGLSDVVAGRSLVNHSRGPLPEYADAVNGIPQLTYGGATREAVISSGADFIYGLDWEFGGAGLDIAELEGYGMTVYVDSAATLEQTYREILDIGRIFDVESVAEAYVADQKARIAAVESIIADQERPKVLICDSVDDGVFTATGVNFETLLLNLAGGENLFADLTEKAWLTVSYEEVMRRVPDVVLIHDYDAPSVEEKIAKLKANDVLGQLDAVKNDRFAVIELESVLPGDRLAYTVETLEKSLYPDLFK
jgi:iron complex transport system substrate-binding protein